MGYGNPTYRKGGYGSHKRSRGTQHFLLNRETTGLMEHRTIRSRTRQGECDGEIVFVSHGSPRTPIVDIRHFSGGD